MEGKKLISKFSLIDRITILVLIFLFSTELVAQDLGWWLNTADSLEIENKIKLETAELRAQLNYMDPNLDDTSKQHKEFKVDTFRIERRRVLHLDHDDTTTGMILSTGRSIDGYDKLLNKYYQLLMSELNDEDQTLLRQTQRDWIAFRDSEFELNGALMSPEYTRGGSIYRVIAISRILEVTRQRVFQLNSYLYYISIY